MIWKIDDDRHKEVKTIVEYLALADADLITNQMKRLIVMAKAFLPPMTSKEAKLLLDSFNGIILLPPTATPLDFLPTLIGNQIRESFIEEPEADPLRRELEEGIDTEWTSAYEALPEVVFANRLQSSLDPLLAYLLLTMIECYWASREHFESEDASFAEFFNIRD